MILDNPSKPHRTQLDCQLLRALATIGALGKTSATWLIMLRCVNCQRFGLLDRCPRLRVYVYRYDGRAILRP
jgi:hypothetical protein